MISSKKLLCTNNLDVDIDIASSADIRIDGCDTFHLHKEQLCNFLLQWYSPDEIMEMFYNSHQGSERIYEFVVKIYDSLNERYSNKDILNIMMNNKESEKFYKQKNAEAKLNNYYLALQILLSTAITAGLCYLLYKIFSMFKFPSIFRSQSTQGNVEKNGPDRLSHNKNRTELTQSEVPRRYTVSHRQESTDNRLLRHEVFGEVIQQNNHAQHARTQDSGQHVDRRVWTVIHEGDVPNNRLREAVAQQIEHARNMGFQLQAVPLDIPEGFKVDIRSLSLLIKEQVAYAKSIGVEPPCAR